MSDPELKNLLSNAKSIVLQMSKEAMPDGGKSSLSTIFHKFTEKSTPTFEKLLETNKAFSGTLKKTWQNHGKKVTGVIDKETTKISDGVKRLSSKTIQTTAVSYNAVMATEIAKSADAFLRDSFAGASNIYDKALDAARIESGHLGGDHRLFDGGHTLSAAWERVKDAVPDDTFIQELRGYIGAIKNDVITPNGLPLGTLDKESFNRFIEQTGVNAEWARDVATYTGTEILGAGVAVLSVIFNWDEKERESFAKFVGGTAVSSIASANPLLGLLSLSASAIAYQKRQDKKELGREMIKGAIPTAAFISTSGLVGGPVAVGLLAGIVAAVLSAKALDRKNSAPSEILLPAEKFAYAQIQNLEIEKNK